MHKHKNSTRGITIDSLTHSNRPRMSSIYPHLDLHLVWPTIPCSICRIHWWPITKGSSSHSCNSQSTSPTTGHENSTSLSRGSSRTRFTTSISSNAGRNDISLISVRGSVMRCYSRSKSIMPEQMQKELEIDSNCRSSRINSPIYQISNHVRRLTQNSTFLIRCSLCHPSRIISTKSCSKLATTWLTSMNSSWLNSSSMISSVDWFVSLTVRQEHHQKRSNLISYIHLRKSENWHLMIQSMILKSVQRMICYSRELMS